MFERRLTAAEWESVRDLGRSVRYPDGHIVMHQGDRNQTVFAIESGEIRITVASSEGSEAVVGVRREGEFVGEMSAFDGLPRSASSVTRGPATLWVLPAGRFRDLLTRHPDMALHLLSVLARRLRELGDQHALRSHELSARVAFRLSALVEETGRTELQITQKELADWVGATREATSRVLIELRRESIVHTGRGRIEILDTDGLARYAVPS